MPHAVRLLSLPVVFLFAFAFAACGGGAEPTPPLAAMAPAAAAPTDTPAAAEQPTKAAEPTSSPAAAPTVASTVEAAAVAAAPPPFSGQPVRLGLQLPLTGAYAAEGLPIKQAVELVVEQINDFGGIGGREVILVAEDDRSDSAAASQIAERLAGQDVVAVIGSVNGVTTDPASYVYNREGILHLMPSCAGPLAIDKSFYQTFRVCFKEERTIQATASFIGEVLDAERVAVLHDGSADAAALAEQVRQTIVQEGAQVVAFENLATGSSGGQPVEDRLKLANPEVIYFAGAAAPAAAVIRDSHNAGLQVVFVLSSSVLSPELAGLVTARGSSAIYVMSDPVSGLLDDPLVDRFMSEYLDRYGSAPTFSGAAAADSIRLVDEAVRATNSTEGQILASYLHDRLRDYPGISGTIQGFDSAGDRVGTGNVVFELTPAGQLVVSAKQP